ncbi:MAG: hypothetical protein R6V20_03725, partial [Desulfobia sp.]
KSLAFFLDGRGGAEGRDDNFFVMLNCGESPKTFHFPFPGRNRNWYYLIDTGKSSPRDFLEEDKAGLVHSGSKKVDYMSAAVLIAKKSKR